MELKELARQGNVGTLEAAIQRDRAAQVAESWEERAAAIEQAKELKALINRQLERGDDPQTVLYNCVECIGLLTNDAVFAEDNKARLDKVWADLAQQALVNDNDAIAAKRLADQQTEYAKLLCRDLKNRSKKLGKLQQDIDALIKKTDWGDLM